MASVPAPLCALWPLKLVRGVQSFLTSFSVEVIPVTELNLHHLLLHGKLTEKAGETPTDFDLWFMLQSVVYVVLERL